MENKKNWVQTVQEKLAWLLGRPYPTIPHLRGNIINGRLSFIREEDGILNTLYLAKPLIEGSFEQNVFFLVRKKKVLIIANPDDIYNIKVRYKELIKNKIESFDCLHDENQSILSEADESWKKKRNTYKQHLTIHKIQSSIFEIIKSYINYIFITHANHINIKELFDDFSIKINQRLLFSLAISPPNQISELSQYKDKLASTILMATSLFGIQESDSIAIAKLKEHFLEILKIFPELLEQNRSSLINAMGKINVKSNEEVRSEDILADFNLLILAGSETNSFALQATIYLLSIHPEVEKKLLQELRKEPFLSLETINQVKYLDRVIKEVFRLYPPAPFILPREINQTLVLTKEVTLEKGDIFFLSAFLTHRLPQIWDSPDDFNPDRFIENKVVKKGAYIPFGLGDRVCPGERLSMTIIKFFIACIYSH